MTMMMVMVMLVVTCDHALFPPYNRRYQKIVSYSGGGAGSIGGGDDGDTLTIMSFSSYNGIVFIRGTILPSPMP